MTVSTQLKADENNDLLGTFQINIVLHPEQAAFNFTISRYSEDEKQKEIIAKPILTIVPHVLGYPYPLNQLKSQMAEIRSFLGQNEDVIIPDLEALLAQAANHLAYKVVIAPHGEGFIVSYFTVHPLTGQMTEADHGSLQRENGELITFTNKKAATKAATDEMQEKGIVPAAYTLETEE